MAKPITVFRVSTGDSWEPIDTYDLLVPVYEGMRITFDTVEGNAQFEVRKADITFADRTPILTVYLVRYSE